MPVEPLRSVVRRVGLGGGWGRRLGSGAGRGLAVAVGGAMLAAGFAVYGAAGATPARLAAVLADRDPGARVDGNTIVVSGNGDHVFGVPPEPHHCPGLG
jgi:hypothetical protein